MSKGEIPTLTAQPREKTGSRYSQRLREQGLIPAVIYGHGEGVTHVTIPRQSIEDLLHHAAHLVNVESADKNQNCLIKDVQYDYLGDSVIHIDLTRVDLSEQVEVQVELRLTGEPPALEEPGAVLNQPVTELTVLCRADSIPEELTHNVEALQVGESVTVGEIALPDGVETPLDEHTVVASISVVAELPEEDEVAEAEDAEPEVIGAASDQEGGEDAGEGDEE